MVRAHNVHFLISVHAPKFEIDPIMVKQLEDPHIAEHNTETNQRWGWFCLGPRLGSDCGLTQYTSFHIKFHQ